MIFVIFCFGEGMRYFFPVFFLQSLVKEVGTSSPSSVSCVFVKWIEGLLLSYPSSTSSVFVEWMGMPYARVSFFGLLCLC